jgi:glycogen operon protein
MLLDGRAKPTGIKRPGVDTSLLLLINGQFEDVTFVLPSANGKTEWRLLVSTANDAVEPSEGHVTMMARSLALYRARPVKR